MSSEIAITHEYLSAMIGSRRASVSDALAKAGCECLGYVEDLRTVLFKQAD